MTLRRGLCTWALGLALLAAAETSRPIVAMVLDLHGTGTVQGPLGERPLTLLTELPAGQGVSLREGATLVLITVAKGESLHFKGPAAFQLDPQGHPSPPVAGLKAEPAKSLQLKNGLKPAGLAQAGLVAKISGESTDGRMIGSFLGAGPGSAAIGSGRRAGVDLISPMEPTIRERRPEFRWKSWGVKPAYGFRLTTQEGQEVFHDEPTQTVLRLPEGADLAPGVSYRWEVLALQSDGQECRGSRQFTVLSKEQEKLLAETLPQSGDPFHQRLFYAFLLERSGLRGEARAAWKLLAAERPEDPVLKEHAR